MASGQVVGQILDIMPPAANFAAPARRAGGSTPAERVLIWQFDAGTIEYLDYKIWLRNYAGGGLTVTLVWSAASATTGNVIWGAAFRRLEDDNEDIDTSQTYDYNDTSGVAAPSASGEVSYDSITFTSGADMDSLADGEIAILRIRRNASSGSDTMTGDAELWGVQIRET